MIDSSKMTENAGFQKLLEKAGAGDLEAWRQVLELVYDDVRRLARQRFGWDMRGWTISPTELAGDVWVRLQSKPYAFTSRQHLLAFLGLITKRIFIEHLRRRQAWRHGGAGVIRIPIGDGAYLQIDARSADLDTWLAVERAIESLRSTEPMEAEVVELRFWVGLTNEEVAEVLGISPSVARSQWETAKEKLRAFLADHDAP